MKILIVSENEAHIDSARKGAARFECQVDFASTLSDILQKLTLENYDGILNDRTYTPTVIENQELLEMYQFEISVLTENIPYQSYLPCSSDDILGWEKAIRLLIESVVSVKNSEYSGPILEPAMLDYL